MAYDYKKEYKQMYNPGKQPKLIEIPKIRFLAVKGKGDPNEENGEYKKSIEKLYKIAYTLRMSYKTGYKIKGYIEYVVPPLEGLWWQEGIKGYDKSKKEELSFISLIRLPDFITKKDFKWAIEEANRKSKEEYKDVEYFEYQEGLCVQAMHIGEYDNEDQTVDKMHEYLEKNGYEIDISKKRYHHEIYISDPRKTNLLKLKTIIRHPIKKKIKNSPKYYIYMLRCEDESIYTGITTDVNRRMEEHFSKSGKCAKYTFRHNAKKLEKVFETTDRKLASKLEYNIKQLSKLKKETLIKKENLEEILGEKIESKLYKIVNFNKEK